MKTEQEYRKEIKDLQEWNRIQFAIMIVLIIFFSALLYSASKNNQEQPKAETAPNTNTQYVVSDSLPVALKDTVEWVKPIPKFKMKRNRIMGEEIIEY
jgi:hypothetical protein